MRRGCAVRYSPESCPVTLADESPLADETVSESAAESLLEEVRRHDLELTPEAVSRLDQYRELLWDWNTKLNLTRHTTLEKFVTRDLVDTLQLSKLLEPGERVLDVGSGGGVPGLPLTILRDDLRVSVCESVAKKSAVLEAMIDDLALPTRLHAMRLEAVLEQTTYDTLIARAVAPLWKFLFWLKPHRQRFGRLLLIKGPGWVDERGEARHRGLMKGFELRRLGEYLTPRTNAMSTILSIAPQAPKRKPR